MIQLLERYIFLIILEIGKTSNLRNMWICITQKYLLYTSLKFEISNELWLQSSEKFMRQLMFWQFKRTTQWHCTLCVVKYTKCLGSKVFKLQVTGRTERTHLLEFESLHILLSGMCFLFEKVFFTNWEWYRKSHSQMVLSCQMIFDRSRNGGRLPAKAG